MRTCRRSVFDTASIVAVVCITSLVGCNAPAPRTDIKISGNPVMMKSPLLKLDGKVGGKQYEPFEIGPIIYRIFGDIMSATGTMNGSEFMVSGTKAEYTYYGMILIHEAFRGCDVKTEDGRTEFGRKAQDLFNIHLH